MNTLYYGDNLKILREYIKTETVDFIHVDSLLGEGREEFDLGGVRK